MNRVDGAPPQRKLRRSARRKSTDGAKKESCEAGGEHAPASNTGAQSTVAAAAASASAAQASSRATSDAGAGAKKPVNKASKSKTAAEAQAQAAMLKKPVATQQETRVALEQARKMDWKACPPLPAEIQDVYAKHRPAARYCAEYIEDIHAHLIGQEVRVFHVACIVTTHWLSGCMPYSCCA